MKRLRGTVKVLMLRNGNEIAQSMKFHLRQTDTISLFPLEADPSVMRWHGPAAVR
jgi:hypothetical protein